MSGAFLAAAADAPPPDYALRLYVAGGTPRSVRAVANLHAICARFLDGRCEVEVIDLYQDRARAEADRIIVAPTLVLSRAGEPQRLIGDLSDLPVVLRALHLDAS